MVLLWEKSFVSFHYGNEWVEDVGRAEIGHTAFSPKDLDSLVSSTS